MADVAAIAGREAQSLKVGQAFIGGRIQGVRSRTDGGFFIILVMPAVDEYSSPSTVELVSESRIGKPGDDWKGVVAVSGFRNNFKTRDGEDVKSARNILAVVR